MDDCAEYGERIAEIYGDRYKTPDPSHAIKAITEFCSTRPEPILELGIGTGRIALPVSDCGIEVHGIDASQSMLSRLREKDVERRIKAEIGDFREIRMPGPYSLIYAAWNTFFFLRTQDEQIQCFRNAAKLLTSTGCFAIECFVPDMNRLKNNQSFETLSAESNHVWLAASTHQAIEQTISRTEIFIDATTTNCYPVHMRYAWPSEIDLMARLAGLRLSSRWGDWDKSLFTSSSTKHVSFFTKE